MSLFGDFALTGLVGGAVTGTLVLAKTADTFITPLGANTKDWGSLSIGSAPAAGYDRWVVVVHAGIATGAPTNRCTNQLPSIGGSTTGVTTDIWEDSEGDYHPFVQISRKIVNSGTTCNITGNFGNSAYSVSVVVYTVTVPQTHSLAVAASGFDADSGASDSLDITVPSSPGAFVAGCMSSYSTTNNITWSGDSGVVEDAEHDQYFGSLKGGAASIGNPAGNTITTTYSGAAIASIICAVSYQLA